jgi:hypothetical protein
LEKSPLEAFGILQQVWIMDLRKRPRNEVSELSLEESWIAKATKARQSRSKIKLMLISFFDMREIFHIEFSLEGQASTSMSTGKFCGV